MKPGRKKLIALLLCTALLSSASAPALAGDDSKVAEAAADASADAVETTPDRENEKADDEYSDDSWLFETEDDDESGGEVADKFIKAAEILVDIGIMQGDDNGDLMLNKSLTRAEFSAFLTRILAMGESVNGYEGKHFGDVGESHWAYNVISALSALNIIDGFSDGNFYPEEGVTTEQAAKLLVCAIGRDFQAQQKGGWPSGYLAVAGECDILKGVEAADGESLNRAKAALMIYNTLTADIMEYDLSKTNIGYNIMRGKTLLSEKLELVKYNGIVTGSEAGNISTPGSLPDGYIEINGEIYDTGKTFAKKYLGYNTEFYYHEEDGVKTIVSIRPYKTRVISIKSEDINDVSYGEIKYYANNKSKTAKLSDNADFIYNSRADLTFDPSSEDADDCNYRLIDNDEDGKYDVVFATHFEDYFVSKADATNSKIYNKNDSSKMLDLDKGLVHYEILIDGSYADIKDIRQNDVLSVAKSRDEDFIHIEVSRERVSGSVTGLGDAKVYINDVEYKISPQFPKDETLEINQTGTFYLNIDGMVVATDIRQKLNDGEYGYLMNFGSDHKDASYSDYKFKIYTLSGKFIYFKGTDKMKINGTKSFDIEKALLRYDKNGDVEMRNDKPRKDQLIKYRLNEDGDIDEIDTALYGYHKDKFSMTGTSRVEEYKPNVGRIGGYGYDDSTIFLRIPSLEKERNFAVISQNTIQQGSSFNIEAFDCNDVNYAKLILIRTDVAGASDDIDHLEPVAIVKSVIESVDEDGENVYTLKAIKDGEEIEVMSVYGTDGDGAPAIDPKKVFFHTDKTIKDLKKGDIIQIGYDSEGKIDRFKFLFGGVPSPEIDVWENGNDDAGLRNNIIFNTIARRTGDYIVVNRSGGKEIIFDISKARNVYTYKPGAKHPFETGTQYDVMEGDTVFIHQNEWNVIDIIVYPDGTLK